MTADVNDLDNLTSNVVPIPLFLFGFIIPSHPVPPIHEQMPRPRSLGRTQTEGRPHTREPTASISTAISPIARRSASRRTVACLRSAWRAHQKPTWWGRYSHVSMVSLPKRLLSGTGTRSAFARLPGSGTTVDRKSRVCFALSTSDDLSRVSLSAAFAVIEPRSFICYSRWLDRCGMQPWLAGGRLLSEAVYAGASEVDSKILIYILFAAHSSLGDAHNHMQPCPLRSVHLSISHKAKEPGSSFSFKHQIHPHHAHRHMLNLFPITNLQVHRNNHINLLHTLERLVVHIHFVRDSHTLAPKPTAARAGTYIQVPPEHREPR